MCYRYTTGQMTREYREQAKTKSALFDRAANAKQKVSRPQSRTRGLSVAPRRATPISRTAFGGMARPL